MGNSIVGEIRQTQAERQQAQQQTANLVQKYFPNGLFGPTSQSGSALFPPNTASTQVANAEVGSLNSRNGGYQTFTSYGFDGTLIEQRQIATQPPQGPAIYDNGTVQTFAADGPSQGTVSSVAYSPDDSAGIPRAEYNAYYAGISTTPRISNAALASLNFAQGVTDAIVQTVYQPVAAAVDVARVTYETGRSLFTGEGPRDIDYFSASGQAAAGGASTSDIIIGGLKGAVTTPVRLGEALADGNAYGVGQELTNLSMLLYGGVKGFQQSGLAAKLGQYNVRSPLISFGYGEVGSLGIKGFQLPIVPNAKAFGLVELDPNIVRYSQTTVREQGATIPALVESMKAKGFVIAPDRLLDVVRMQDGSLTTLDNTRILAAQRAGINVQARIFDFADLLPNNEQYISRFIGRNGEVPVTFGDAVQNRIGNQKPAFRNQYPYGSFYIGSAY